MPQIIPIRDLKNTAEISKKCRLADAPIFITKNGYSDMVIMSMNRYEESLAKLDIYSKLDEAEQQIAQGKTIAAETSMKRLRAKHHV
ncbi:MAG: type II toxin-antitoxin system Phd/YefM family antitoxin [Kiritimatiellae bacterium]|nr:type II toxin-antitoxin system Phd/YefM family antitoxin [Kiritimatiellia bacterium]